MTLEEIRNKLCQEKKKEKDQVYINGYLDGILDFYNQTKGHQWISTSLQDTKIATAK